MLLTQEDRREDPRVTRTRQLLHQALLELMMEKSFQAITIQDIADRATVNRVTFYAHFQDKFALLEYSVREMFKERLHERLSETAVFSPENLATLILVVCEFLRGMFRECPAPHGQMDSLMEKQIKEVIYERLFSWSDDLAAADNGEQKAMITAWAIYGAAVQWNQQKKPQPIDSFVAQVLPIIRAGFDVQVV
jgi:AcrR family transcriptional regulator